MSQLENKPDVSQRGRIGVLRLLQIVVKRYLAHNVLLKVFSLFLAVLLWSVLIASDASLTREKVFQNVEVTVVGEDALMRRGFIVTDNLSELLPTVRIRADVAQGQYDRVASSNFSPRIDLSPVRQAGEQELQVSVLPSAYGTVLEVDPSRVTVNVQEYATNGRIPVVVDMAGKADPALWVDTPHADPVLVSVSGPKAMVDRVSRVVALLDQSTLSANRASMRNALKFVPQDTQGNVIDSPLLQVSNYEGVLLNSILVDVACYPQREIPVDLSSAIQGTPAEGFELVSVQADPPGITVAASQSVLDATSRVLLDTPLNIDGATSMQTGSIRIKRIVDAKHLSQEDVLLTATIAEQRVERALRNLPISVIGLTDDCTIKLNRSKTGANVTGPYHWIKQLKDTNVSLYIDASNLAPGSYDLPVKVRIEGASDFTCAVDDTTVNVTIAEKVE